MMLQIDHIHLDASVQIHHSVTADTPVHGLELIGKFLAQMRGYQCGIAAAHITSATSAAAGIGDGVALKKNGLLFQEETS